MAVNVEPGKNRAELMVTLVARRDNSTHTSSAASPAIA
jgi:hypothetical protein